MLRRRPLSAALAALLLLAAWPACAQYATPGGSCTTVSNGSLANSNGFFTCTSGVWVTNPITAASASIGSYAGTAAPSNGLIVSGNVGIGTATPQSLLHVYGGEVQVGSSGAGCTSANGGALRYASGSLSYCNGSSWTGPTASAAGSTGYVQFNNGGALGSDSNFFWSSTSHALGIGTASPQSTLHVNGGEVQVGSSGASCSSANAGAMRYASNTMYYCNGSAWNPFSSSCSGASGSDTSLTSGLVAYWSFNAGTGTTVNDNAGNGNTGAWQGTLGSQWTTGKIGYGVKFDGSSNYVALGTPSDLEGLQVPLTITGWFNQTSGGPSNQPIYAAYLNVASSELWSLVRLDGGILRYYTSTSSGGFQSAGSFTPSTGSWHFFAVVVSGSISSPSVTIYLDGSSQSSSLSALSSSPNTTVPIEIGGDAAGASEKFYGVIDEVGVWNVALTSTQVATLYNSGAGNALSAMTCPAIVNSGFTN